MSKDKILRAVTKYYLESPDFNGISAKELIQQTGLRWDVLRISLQELITEERTGILYIDSEANTHIIRTGFLPKTTQIEKLGTTEFDHTCIYPRPSHLKLVVDTALYSDQPYKLCLALGEPQLSFKSFDLSVLEIYRNDPRYFYETDDIFGSLSARGGDDETNRVTERDSVVLETFGFAYDQDFNRTVAAYLRYLSDLSPAHQQIWKSKEVYGQYSIHPNYMQSTVYGAWSEGVPVLTALVNELYIINKMSQAMGRPPLFRKDFGEFGEGKPTKLSLLVRPTLEEFNSFVLLFDKSLSDNINKEFFKKEVAYETELERSDGKIVVQPKGTLQILDEWVRKYFRADDWEPWNNVTAALREVRKLRQKPAHAIDENVFDQLYFKEQRQLIIRVYIAVKTLRLLFSKHPNVVAANIEVPDWLLEGNIWYY